MTTEEIKKLADLINSSSSDQNILDFLKKMHEENKLDPDFIFPQHQDMGFYKIPLY